MIFLFFSVIALCATVVYLSHQDVKKQDRQWAHDQTASQENQYTILSEEITLGLKKLTDFERKLNLVSLKMGLK